MSKQAFAERCQIAQQLLPYAQYRAMLTALHAEMLDEVARLNKAVADEREACAKVCEEEASRAKWNWDNDISGNQPFWNGGEQLASSCAAAIRARGNT